MNTQTPTNRIFMTIESKPPKLFCKLFPLIILFFLIGNLAFSQTPSREEIFNIASEFTAKFRNSNTNILKSGQFQYVANIESISKGDSILLNVANIYPRGFIIFSNSKSIDPIIAYSDHYNFNEIESSDQFLKFLKEDLLFRLQATKQNVSSNKWEKGISQLSADLEQWPSVGSTNSGGWIETTWNQSAPYNSLFPIDPKTNKKVVTGCVTTAYAQLLNYYKVLGGGYLNSNYAYVSTGINNTEINIDSDHTNLDFLSFTELNQQLDELRDKYNANIELNATNISALNLLAAILVKANFSSSSTSANIYNIESSLKSFFNYNTCDISSTLNAEILNTLKNNIRLARPALISVHNSSGSGHLIICDGYNTNEFFHLNFGWGENAPEPITDVWYNIPMEIPAGFNIFSNIIYNINPQEEKIHTSTSFLELYPLETLLSRSFTISSNIDAKVSLSCKEVEISLDNKNYQKVFNSVDLNPGTSKEIWVRYSPNDQTIDDLITITLNDIPVNYINIKGYSAGNIIAGGEINGVWGDTDKPYIVTNDIIIRDNDSLQVNEGVVIYFMNNSGLIVDGGKLDINGTSDNPVRLSSFSDDDKWEGIDIISSKDIQTIKNAIIINSQSSGVYCQDGKLEMINCLIANNCSEKGGGVYLKNTEASLIGCIVVNNYNVNWSNNLGGGIMADSADVKIVNCTISKNRSSIGGGVYINASKIDLMNTIVWDNYAQTYLKLKSNYIHKELSLNILNSKINATNCIIQNISKTDDGLGNKDGLLLYLDWDDVIEQSPAFINPSSTYGLSIDPLKFDWRLKNYSGAINNGTNQIGSKIPEYDFYGNKRISFKRIDIGAAESVDSTSMLTIDPLSKVEFPPTELSSINKKKLMLLNTGGDSIFVSTNVLNKDIFTASELFDNRSIAPGDSLEMEISYTPKTDFNIDSGYVVVYSTSENAVYRKILLTGTCVNGNFIEGEVFGQWDKSNSPYVVVGKTWVKNNEQLTIEKGTRVIFTKKTGLEIADNAIIAINGEQNDKVVFTGLGNWSGLSFLNCKNRQIINYFEVSEVKNHFAISLLSTPIILSNSYIHDNHYCIHMNNNTSSGHTYEFMNNKFSSNTKNILTYENGLALGLNDNTDTLFIIGNEFENNRLNSAIQLTTQTQINFKIDQNSIHDNYFLNANIEHYSEFSDVKYNSSVSENLIYNNTSESYLGINIDNDNVLINNNLIVDNSSAGSQSYIIKYIGGDGSIINNTIANNENSSKLLYISTVPANFDLWNQENRIKVYNNICYNNKNSDFLITGVSSHVDIDYSLCTNNYSNSKNNYNFDPLFNNYNEQLGVKSGFDITDWYLSDQSPAIDAGNPDLKYNDQEDQDDIGNAKFPSKSSVRNDLGAFGGDYLNKYTHQAMSICEGDRYKGFGRNGHYLESYIRENGADSIVFTEINVIESALIYDSPTPAIEDIIAPNQAFFSWETNSDADTVQFEVLLSTDQKHWFSIYIGYEKSFYYNIDERSYSGKTLYWYVVDNEEYCPQSSPVWSFVVDIKTLNPSIIDTNNFTVFPNPCRDIINISLGCLPEGEIKINIYNVLGEKELTTVLYSDQYNQGLPSINVSTLLKGTYLLVVETEANRFSKRFIKD